MGNRSLNQFLGAFVEDHNSPTIQSEGQDGMGLAPAQESNVLAVLWGDRDGFILDVD